MKNLSFERLMLDARTFTIAENDSYIATYPEFLNYFKEITEIEKHHLIIATHFVYGWMPTILKLDNSQIGEVLLYLNAAKAGHLLSTKELKVLKHCINNSMVGTSKLLHFINPYVYPIWDSKVLRYLTDNKYSYGIDKPDNYLRYLEALKQIINHNDFRDLHSLIERNFEYEISSMRAIEILMFETDRQRGKDIVVTPIIEELGNNLYLIKK